ncbi:hypothetical protein cyc_02915 [Cyclospora cayetanensis]|uniref:Uncharacterized protein n=1 Tax=Cyclospora cayetanensis TaxID=88456 RepID=A0A1D3CTF4_9EIME|nr:hypothetical protein cyc_02915 [Cyclospora cayetanensis]
MTSENEPECAEYSGNRNRGQTCNIESGSASTSSLLPCSRRGLLRTCASIEAAAGAAAADRSVAARGSAAARIDAACAYSVAPNPTRSASQQVQQQELTQPYKQGQQLMQMPQLRQHSFAVDDLLWEMLAPSYAAWWQGRAAAWRRHAVSSYKQLQQLSKTLKQQLRLMREKDATLCGQRAYQDYYP